MSVQNAMLKLKATSEGAFDRPSSVIKFIALMTAPFVLLIISGREPNSVPWYLLAMAVLLLMLLMVVGFFMFAHESHSAEDISIRPKNR